MIVIMAGGRAERMGRGVKSVDTTKGLMLIPKASDSNNTETLIDRTIRLLRKINFIKKTKDILICTGYKEEEVKERYPRCQFLTTYDPDNPSDLLPAYLKIIEAFPEENQFTIFLGDVVWSEKTMRHFISMKKKSPLVFYHSEDNAYTKIFALAINGDQGKDLVCQANAVKDMPVVSGEIRWAIQNIKRISPQDVRTSCFEQWIDLKKLSGKSRIYQQGPVDDINWDADHIRVCNDIKKGLYDK